MAKKKNLPFGTRVTALFKLRPGRSLLVNAWPPLLSGES